MKDEHATKTVLDAERIRKDLLFTASVPPITYVFIAALMVAMFGAFSALGIYYFVTAFAPKMLLSLIDFGLGVLALIAIVALLLPIVHVGITTYSLLHERYLIRKGRYFITEDTLEGYAENEYHYSFWRAYFFSSTVHNECALYFSRYGRVRVAREDLNYAAAGDRYYLVLYKTRRTRVIRWYNQKMYELPKKQ
ncbi:MAG: hypothetical protein IJW16_04985 [Clostridia bacterium]|nr:hypothetical protein [Clostridia bacterium]